MRELRKRQRLHRHGGDDAERHHLAGLVAEGVAIDLLVRLVEVLDDHRSAFLAERSVRNVRAQLEALADVAAFGDLAETPLRLRNAIGLQLLVGAAGEAIQHLVDAGEVLVGSLVEHDQRGLRVFVLEVGHQKARRGSDAGLHRHDHVLGVDRLHERDGMERARTAEPHEREVARVNALGDRVGVDRQRHVVVYDLEDAERRLLDVHLEGARDVLRNRLLGQRGVDRQVAAEEVLRVHAAQHHLRIRHGRLPAALAVAGRPRYGTRRTRADAECPTRIDVGDRAAAGTNGVDVDHRHQDGQARHFRVARVLDAQLAVLDDADVGGGAADVDGDHVLLAAVLARPAPGDDAARGA